MLLGILSDTHDELDRTRRAIQRLCAEGAAALVHCGDLTSPPIVAACALLPCYFTFGNHDADSVPELRQAAAEHGAMCLGWGGLIELHGKRIGVVHGHLTSDLQRVLAESPDYLLTGHLHFPIDTRMGPARRINPGALHRSDEYTVAILDLATDKLRVIHILESE